MFFILGVRSKIWKFVFFWGGNSFCKVSGLRLKGSLDISQLATDRYGQIIFGKQNADRKIVDGIWI